MTKKTCPLLLAASLNTDNPVGVICIGGDCQCWSICSGDALAQIYESLSNIERNVNTIRIRTG